MTVADNASTAAKVLIMADKESLRCRCSADVVRVIRTEWRIPVGSSPHQGVFFAVVFKGERLC